MAKLSAKGSFNLFLGVTLSTIISAMGTILVVRLLGPSQYGLYLLLSSPPPSSASTGTGEPTPPLSNLFNLPLKVCDKILAIKV